MAEDKLTKRLPALMIDFSKDVDYNLIYPLTDASMASALGGTKTGWTADKVRLVNASHGLFNDVPMYCLGCVPETEEDDEGNEVPKDNTSCPYADNCPIEKDTVQKVYKGGPCPVEIITAFKIWAGYLLDLGIGPDDFTDWQIVVDLVRLHIMQRRLDLYSRKLPVWEPQIGGIHQKTGKAYYNKVPNLAFQMHKDVRKDIQEKYDMLIASREAKFKRDSQLRDGNSPTDFIDRIQKQMQLVEQKRLGAEKKSKSKKDLEAIDAEFTEEQNQDEQE